MVAMPLLAVRVTVNGEPVVSGAVPLRTPETESRLAHEGNPVAVYDGEGEAVAATVKVPPTVARKVALASLEKTGAVPMPSAAEKDVAFVPIRFETTTWKRSPDIAEVTLATVSVALFTPL